MLSKAQEEKILKDAIAKLGDDSYLGPALKRLIPFAVSEMRSDIEPDLLGSLELMAADVSRLDDERKLLAGQLRELNGAILTQKQELARVNNDLASGCARLRALWDDLGRILRA